MLHELLDDLAQEPRWRKAPAKLQATGLESHRLDPTPTADHQIALPATHSSDLLLGRNLPGAAGRDHST